MKGTYTIKGSSKSWEIKINKWWKQWKIPSIIENPSKVSKMIVTALNLLLEASAVSGKPKFITCVTGHEAWNFRTNYDLGQNFVMHHTQGTYDRKPTVYAIYVIICQYWFIVWHCDIQWCFPNHILSTLAIIVTLHTGASHPSHCPRWLPTHSHFAFWSPACDTCQCTQIPQVAATVSLISSLQQTPGNTFSQRFHSSNFPPLCPPLHIPVSCWLSSALTLQFLLSTC